MKQTVFRNLPLVVSILFLVSYWTVGAAIPKPGMSNVVGIMALLAGIFLFLQYVDTAFGILFKNERDANGAHWAVYGATVAAMGTIYSGAFRLLWNHFGNPTSWQATTTSSFGLALVTGGFLMMGFSHERVKLGNSYPRGFWKVITVIFAIVAAFIAGMNFAGS